jgi:hypothetical protein
MRSGPLRAGLTAERLQRQRPNKRMQLAVAAVIRNVGLCAVKESPQLMRDPLDGRISIEVPWNSSTT